MHLMLNTDIKFYWWKRSINVTHTVRLCVKFHLNMKPPHWAWSTASKDEKMASLLRKTGKQAPWEMEQVWDSEKNDRQRWPGETGRCVWPEQGKIEGDLTLATQLWLCGAASGTHQMLCPGQAEAQVNAVSTLFHPQLLRYHLPIKKKRKKDGHPSSYLHFC